MRRMGCQAGVRKRRALADGQVSDHAGLCWPRETLSFILRAMHEKHLEGPIQKTLMLGNTEGRKRRR